MPGGPAARPGPHRRTTAAVRRSRRRCRAGPSPGPGSAGVHGRPGRSRRPAARRSSGTPRSSRGGRMGGRSAGSPYGPGGGSRSRSPAPRGCPGDRRPGGAGSSASSRAVITGSIDDPRSSGEALGHGLRSLTPPRGPRPRSGRFRSHPHARTTAESLKKSRTALRGLLHFPRWSAVGSGARFPMSCEGYPYARRRRHEWPARALSLTFEVNLSFLPAI